MFLFDLGKHEREKLIEVCHDCIARDCKESLDLRPAPSSTHTHQIQMGDKDR